MLRNRAEFKDVPNTIVNESLDKKIENTVEVVIGYPSYPYTARITDQEKIKQLEDLFNSAKFSKSDEPIVPGLIDITFYGRESSTKFLIAKNNVIVIEDDKYGKAKDISCKSLHSIFEEYVQ